MHLTTSEEKNMLYCIYLFLLSAHLYRTYNNHQNDLNDVLCVCLLQKDLIILDDVHKAFAVDALASSHPLSSEEDSIILPDQISEQFDDISYSKVHRQAHPV